MDVRGSLSRSELETLLETTAVPVRLACHRPDDSLWMLSLWFRYREETIECATATSADVVAFLERDPAVAFEVSTNDPPYRGVRGNGTATVEPDPEKAVLRKLLERYLETTDGPLARRLLSDDRDEVTISIDLETVYGWDYSGRMAGSEQ